MYRRVAFVLLASLAFAGVVWSQAAKPKVVAPATITRTDGTSVRGTITAADRMKLTVQPVAGKPGTPAPAEVVIEWAQIKSVSNGLARPAAQQQWKAKQTDPNALCGDCAGDGVKFCGTCKGTGRDPASAAACTTCKGELLVDCKTPKCDKGTIVCPNKCLKATQFTNKPEADGHKWIRFSGPKGVSVRVSDAHIGEVVTYSPDGAPSLEKCTTCKGTTLVDDPACEGGKQPCPTDVARRTASACPKKCDNGKVDCDKCKGTGAKAN